MEWLKPQIEYLLLLQNFREWSGGIFDNFFLFVTSLAEITLPMVITAGVYWCINSRHGWFIFWTWGLGHYVSEFLKSIFCIYRPWIIDNRLHPVDKAFYMSGGYSFPSGHTQTGVCVYGSIAYCFKKNLLSVISVILILLIAFSRNYLGVHTPQDVIVSLLVGSCLIIFAGKFMKWAKSGNNRDLMIFLTAVVMAAGLLLFEHFKSYPMDYINGELIVDPVKMRLFAFPKIGLFSGVFTGWFLDNRFLHFDGSLGTVKEKIVRFFAGVLIIVFLAHHSVNFYEIFVAKKYALFLTAFTVSLFITFIYPLILVNLKRKFNTENICQNQRHQNNTEV